MSYEYMQGMFGLGALPKNAVSEKTRLTPEEAKERILEVCGGIGCIGVTTEPVIFRSDSPKISTILSNMSSRGCMVQCTKDNMSYYCCPSREAETSTERQERVAAACGGEGCTEPGMTRIGVARTDTLQGLKTQERMIENGCVSRCEEGGWAYFCCPSSEEVIVEEPVVPEIDVALQPVVAPVDQGAGTSAGLILLLGLLGVGLAGFAGYWFLLRDKDEEEEDDDETVVETVVEEE